MLKVLPSSGTKDCILCFGVGDWKKESDMKENINITGRPHENSSWQGKIGAGKEVLWNTKRGNEQL